MVRGVQQPGHTGSNSGIDDSYECAGQTYASSGGSIIRAVSSCRTSEDPGKERERIVT